MDRMLLQTSPTHRLNNGYKIRLWKIRIRFVVTFYYFPLHNNALQSITQCISLEYTDIRHAVSYSIHNILSYYGSSNQKFN